MKRASVRLWLLLLPPAVPAQAPTLPRPVVPQPQVTALDESLQSASLGGPMRYRVRLPAGYETSSRRYAALYLLHGLTGAYSDWEGRTHLTEYCARRPCGVSDGAFASGIPGFR